MAKKGRGGRKEANRRRANHAALKQSGVVTTMNVSQVAEVVVAVQPEAVCQLPLEVASETPFVSLPNEHLQSQETLVVQRECAESLRARSSPRRSRDLRRAGECIADRKFEKRFEHYLLCGDVSYSALLGLRYAQSFYTFLRVHMPRWSPKAMKYLRAPFLQEDAQEDTQEGAREYLWQKDGNGIFVTSFGHAWWELFRQERVKPKSIIQRLIREGAATSS